MGKSVQLLTLLLIRIYFNLSILTYAAAREHLSMAECTSNLESEVECIENQRGRASRIRELSSQMSDSDLSSIENNGSESPKIMKNLPPVKGKTPVMIPPPPAISKNVTLESGLFCSPGFVLAPGSGTISRVDQDNMPRTGSSSENFFPVTKFRGRYI